MKKVWFATAAVGATLAGCTGGGGDGSLASPTGGLFSDSPSAAASVEAHLPRRAQQPRKCRHDHLSVAPHRPRQGRHVQEVRRRLQCGLPRRQGEHHERHQLQHRHTHEAGFGRTPIVLDIVPGTPNASFPTYFLPDGTVDELAKTYNWTSFSAYQGKVYGLATFGNVSGMVVNSAVWKKAGIDVTRVPTGQRRPRSSSQTSRRSSLCRAWRDAVLHQLQLTAGRRTGTAPPARSVQP